MRRLRGETMPNYSANVSLIFAVDSTGINNGVWLLSPSWFWTYSGASWIRVAGANLNPETLTGSTVGVMKEREFIALSQRRQERDCFCTGSLLYLSLKEEHSMVSRLPPALVGVRHIGRCSCKGFWAQGFC